MEKGRNNPTLRTVKKLFVIREKIGQESELGRGVLKEISLLNSHCHTKYTNLGLSPMLNRFSLFHNLSAMEYVRKSLPIFQNYITIILLNNITFKFLKLKSSNGSQLINYYRL